MRKAIELNIGVTSKKKQGGVLKQIFGSERDYLDSEIDFSKVFEAFKTVVTEQLSHSASANSAGIKATFKGPGGQDLERFAGRSGRSVLNMTMPEASTGAYLSTLAYTMQRSSDGGENFKITIGGMASNNKNVSEYAALIDKAFSNGQYVVKRTHTFKGFYDGHVRYTTLYAGQEVTISQPVDTSKAMEAAIAEFKRQIDAKGPSVLGSILFTKYDGIKTPLYSYRNEKGQFARYS